MPLTSDVFGHQHSSYIDINGDLLQVHEWTLYVKKDGLFVHVPPGKYSHKPLEKKTLIVPWTEKYIPV